MNSSSSNWWITYYSPQPIKVTTLTIRNFNGASSYAGYFTTKAGSIYGSNDNSTWTLLTNYTNSTMSYGAQWSIDLSSNTKHFKYIKITSTQINSAYSSEGWAVDEIYITATYKKGADLTEFQWASPTAHEYFIKY